MSRDGDNRIRLKADNPATKLFSASGLYSDIHRATFEYFWSGAHPRTGLPFDRLTDEGKPINDIVSISGVGFGLMAILVGAEQGWIDRGQAIERALRMVRSLSSVKRFHGALPHLIHAQTLEILPFSRRDDGADLVETALFLQGLICAREYFAADIAAEVDFRALANRFIQGVEWSWFTRSKPGALYWHWSPNHHWARNVPISGWNEALVTYVLAAGAETHAIKPETYHAGWARSGGMVNGNSYLGTVLPLGEPFGGPLFLSQYSFCGLNPFELRDRYGDYRQQVIAHARINHDYCEERFGSNGPWGMTACDGPKGYRAFSPTVDGGIVAPTAALSSFAFLPDEAERALNSFASHRSGALIGQFGFVDSFSPLTGWAARTHLATNQGPIVAMMENHRTGLLWRLFMQASEVQRGLGRLGFDRAA